MNRREFMQGSTAVGAAMLMAPSARATEAGVHADRIVFGQSLGFESIWATTYRNYTNGLLAYFSFINAQGGVHGRKLELKQLDDRYEPDRTVANIRQLLLDNVFGLTCLGGTGNTAAVLPLLEQHRLPTVGTLTGAGSLRKAGAPLFHTRASYDVEVTKMIQHATTVGLKRVAVVYQDNAFGAACAQAARDNAQRFGAQLVAVLPHDVQGKDLDTVVDRIRASNPQTTLLFTSPQFVADLLLRHDARHGPMAQPWILSVTTVKTVHEKAGLLSRGVAMTQVMPNPTSGKLPLVREFRDINDRYGVRTNQTYEAVEGFLTAKVIVEGLRACGASPTREAFIRNLERSGSRDFGGVRVYYDTRDHGGLDFVDVAMIGEGGRIVS